MMKITGSKITTAAVLLSVFAMPQLRAQTKPAPASIAALEASISAQNIRTQDQFISDDLFEGRYPGLRGGELAAKYIATQFALDGLVPPATTAPTSSKSTSSA
jgi:hypothetical protein